MHQRRRNEAAQKALRHDGGGRVGRTQHSGHEITAWFVVDRQEGLAGKKHQPP